MSFVVPGITHCEEHMNPIGLGYVCEECEKERNKKRILTNRQWLFNEMQNMSDEELAGAMNNDSYICNVMEKTCGQSTGVCEQCTLDWLKQEHKEKSKLSDAERDILENTSQIYKWIARDKCGTLHLFTQNPHKDNFGRWVINSGCFERLNIFNHLFQFIKWEDTEAYNIEELLKQ